MRGPARSRDEAALKWPRFSQGGSRRCSAARSAAFGTVCEVRLPWGDARSSVWTISKMVLVCKCSAKEATAHVFLFYVSATSASGRAALRSRPRVPDGAS